MKHCIGYEIVCPDGRVRHFPYHNEGDATCDAECYTERRNCGEFAGPGCPPEWSDPPCPQGEHTARPVPFTHGESERGSA